MGRWRFNNKFLSLVCVVITITVIYMTHVSWKVRKTIRAKLTSANNDSRVHQSGIHRLISANRNNKSNYLITPITVFLRMAGKLKEHRTRFYCDFYRSAVLFWPPSFGKTVVVLDEESERDHAFANTLTKQVREHFPDHKLEVLYEPLPKDQSILNFPGEKTFGYNRQLWSSFFIDLYTNDNIIAWMDSDAAFITPVTEASIFTGKKPRILGSDCTMNLHWVQDWARNTETALGMPMVADFMTYFPVYLYRNTFTHCREYILKRFNTSSFEEAFKKFYHQGTRRMSPVCVIISYAWFFERERYDWNLKICNDLSSYNKRFPSGHTIGPQHIENILSEPQTAFHVPYAEFLSSNIFISYCLSHAVVGSAPAICTNHSLVSLRNNLVLFNHDLQRVENLVQTPCTGDNTNACLQVLKRHYNQIGLEIKRNERKLDWRDLEIVEKLANEVDIVCKSLK